MMWMAQGIGSRGTGGNMAGHLFITNDQLVKMEEFVEDWEINDAPDINDDPEWLIDRINDDILPMFKEILNALS